MKSTTDCCEKYHQLEHVPSFLKFNPYIIRGFRIGYNLKSLGKSLFQWHNETINTWTHLLGTLAIFVFILSSNLLTQHYHSKHQILHFGERIENQRVNISSGLKDIKLTKSSPAEVTEDNRNHMTVEIINSIFASQQQITNLLRLTEQDGFVERSHIQKCLKHLKQARHTIQQNLIQQSLGLSSNNSRNESGQFLSGLSNIEYKLNGYLLEVIMLIESLGEKVNPIPKWPLLIFITAASICLTASAAFHLFYPHSEKLYKILRRLDFSGVIILIVGSAFPTFVYGANCISHIAYFYLSVMSIIGLTVFGLLVTSYFERKDRQKQKSWLFGLFGVSFIIPLTHILIKEYLGQTNDTMMLSQFAKRIVIFGGVYLIGLFIYTVQCPQRFAAGKFDYCGASHQIWHLSVLVALYLSYQLNWDLYYERRMSPCLA